MDRDTLRKVAMDVLAFYDVIKDEMPEELSNALTEQVFLYILARMARDEALIPLFQPGGLLREAA